MLYVDRALYAGRVPYAGSVLYAGSALYAERALYADRVLRCAVYELQKLCDDVPHFDHALAMQTIQDELGALPETLFDELVDAEVPIAAASLGQVRTEHCSILLVF